MPPTRDNISLTNRHTTFQFNMAATGYWLNHLPTHKYRLVSVNATVEGWELRL